MRVSLPPLGILAVDLVASLFRLTNGDTEQVGEQRVGYIFIVRDINRFTDKLQNIRKNKEHALRTSFGLLGAFIAGRMSSLEKPCGVKKIQELADKFIEEVKGDPNAIFEELSTYRYTVDERGKRVVLEWGLPPFLEHPPLIISDYEYVEGVRLWPAVQLAVSGGGKKAKVDKGFRREINVSCSVLGAVATGFAAAYVSSEIRGRIQWIKLLVPVSMLELNIGEELITAMSRANCKLPEHLMVLLTATTLRKPAVVKIVDLSYSVKSRSTLRGRARAQTRPEIKKDASSELAVDVAWSEEFLVAASAVGVGNAFATLAEHWCRCDRERWRNDACKAVEALTEAARHVLLYAENKEPQSAYMAKAFAMRAAGHGNKELLGVAKKIVDFVDRL